MPFPIGGPIGLSDPLSLNIDQLCRNTGENNARGVVRLQVTKDTIY